MTESKTLTYRSCLGSRSQHNVSCLIESVFHYFFGCSVAGNRKTCNWLIFGFQIFFIGFFSVCFGSCHITLWETTGRLLFHTIISAQVAYCVHLYSGKSKLCDKSGKRRLTIVTEHLKCLFRFIN